MRVASCIFVILLGWMSIAYGQDDSSDPNAGVVVCGAKKDVICHLDQGAICCQGLSSAKCSRPSACNGGMSAPAYCDGPEDCTASTGKICCAKFSMGGGSGTRCESSCAGTKSEAILCHKDSDCNAPNTCKSCQPPGGPAISMCVTQCPY